MGRDRGSGHKFQLLPSLSFLGSTWFQESGTRNQFRQRRTAKGVNLNIIDSCLLLSRILRALPDLSTVGESMTLRLWGS